MYKVKQEIDQIILVFEDNKPIFITILISLGLFWLFVFVDGTMIGFMIVSVFMILGIIVSRFVFEYELVICANKIELRKVCWGKIYFSSSQEYKYLTTSYFNQLHFRSNNPTSSVHISHNKGLQSYFMNILGLDKVYVFRISQLEYEEIYKLILKKFPAKESS